MSECKISRRRSKDTYSSRQIRIASCIINTIKVANALKWVLKSSRRKKRAISERDINRAVHQHFQSSGLRNAPDLDWINIFTAPVKQLSIINKWPLSKEEAILSTVVQDILMGENINTGNKWSHGSLSDKIITWREEGRGLKEMRKFLKRQVWQHAKEEGRMHNRSVRYTPEHFPQHNFDPTRQEVDGDYESILHVLDTDSNVRNKIEAWMSLMDPGNKYMRDLLRKMDSDIQERSDWKTALVWKVMKESPGFKSRRQLGDDEVTFKDPQTGDIITKPLYKALGKSKPENVYYEVNKIEDMLAHYWPQVRELLEDSHADEYRR